MRALITLIVATGCTAAWAAGPASQPDELDALIRQADEAIKQRAVQPDKPATQPEGQAAGEDDRDKDLVDMLLEQAAGAGRKPIMQEILANMAESRSRLREQFDPGTRTQEVQRKIIRDLDEAIAMAQQSQQGGGQSRSKAQKQDKGRRQSQDQGNQPKPGDGQPQPNRSTSPATSERATHGSVQTGERNPEIKETRNTWGQLPDRERSEIVQAQNEEALPRWRAMIEKYYTALQVQAQGK